MGSQDNLVGCHKGDAFQIGIQIRGYAASEDQCAGLPGGQARNAVD
jgi:hypothetical protein